MPSFPRDKRYSSGGKMPRGKGNYILIVDKNMQKSMGINIGDSVHVEMALVGDYVPKIEAEKQIKVMSGMDTITAIKTRRSIEKFTDQRVEDELIHTILDAGFCAPSAKDKRPWHFVVVREKETMKGLARTCSYYQPLVRADCCILVCGDKVAEGMTDLMLEGCSASVQNMLIAIQALGLGGIWLGFQLGAKKYAYMAELLNLPPKIVPVAMIALGYPLEQKEEYDRFDQAKVHFEKW